MERLSLSFLLTTLCNAGAGASSDDAKVADDIAYALSQGGWPAEMSELQVRESCVSLLISALLCSAHGCGSGSEETFFPQMNDADSIKAV